MKKTNNFHKNMTGAEYARAIVKEIKTDEQLAKTENMYTEEIEKQKTKLLKPITSLPSWFDQEHFESVSNFYYDGKSRTWLSCCEETRKTYINSKSAYIIQMTGEMARDWYSDNQEKVNEGVNWIREHYGEESPIMHWYLP